MTRVNWTGLEICVAGGPGITVLGGDACDDLLEPARDLLVVRDRRQAHQHRVQAAQVCEAGQLTIGDAPEQVAEQRGLTGAEIADQRQARASVARVRECLVERDLGVAVADSPNRSRAATGSSGAATGRSLVGRARHPRGLAMASRPELFQTCWIHAVDLYQAVFQNIGEIYLLNTGRWLSKMA
jgi:hypothetical protein